MTRRLANSGLLRALIGGTVIAASMLLGSGVRRSFGRELVGVNEAITSYYHPELRLNNLSRRCGGWLSRTKSGAEWTDRREIEVDELGYPSQLAADQVAVALVTTHNGGNYPVGEYTLSWSGDADVAVHHPGLEELSRRPGRVVCRIAEPSGLGLQIVVSRVNPPKPLRDLSLVSGDSPRDGFFTAEFLREVRRFDIVRTMDLGRTNGSPQEEWADRPTVDHLLWGTTGWPWEAQIELSNRTGKPIWISVPHAATDDYVRRLAKLFAERLAPSLEVWVEYSNEVWNRAPRFPQGKWVANNLTDWRVRDANEAGGRRAAQVWKIFEQELGEERVTNVIAGQAGYAGVLERAIAGAARVDGVSPEVGSFTSYFDLPPDRLYKLFETKAEDPNAVFDAIDDFIHREATQRWRANAEVCRKNGLRIVAYEGGSHLVSHPSRFRDEEWVTFLRDLHLHPRMRDTYRLMRQQYRGVGGDGIVYYTRLANWSKWGYWGHRRSPLDASAPRWLALEEHLNEVAGKSVGGDLLRSAGVLP